ncbi:hypothetical protein JHK87_016341 [Glycine soja]|nr:hypothetical protein JHK87_016341 [Glycine soja]
MSQILFDVTAIVNVIASHCRCCPSKPLFVVLSHALCSIAPIADVIGTSPISIFYICIAFASIFTVMADTLGNIETQEIESINVMPMDTPISFEEVMPGDASNDAEEMNIQPCLGLEFESLEKVREFYNSFAKKNGFGIRIQSSKPKMINKFTKKRITRDGPSYAYQVSSWYDARDTFIVNVDLDSKVAKCDDQLFEFMGILWRHILVIFQEKGVVQIPDHFVLQLWTKDANKCIEVSDIGNNFDGQSTTSRILRRMHTQQQANILVDLAEELEEIYRFIVLELGQTHKLAIVMKTSLPTGDNIPLLESSLTIGNKLCMP